MQHRQEDSHFVYVLDNWGDIKAKHRHEHGHVVYVSSRSTSKLYMNRIVSFLNIIIVNNLLNLIINNELMGIGVYSNF